MSPAIKVWAAAPGPESLQRKLHVAPGRERTSSSGKARRGRRNHPWFRWDRIIDSVIMGVFYDISLIFLWFSNLVGLFSVISFSGIEWAKQLWEVNMDFQNHSILEYCRIIAYRSIALASCLSHSIYTYLIIFTYLHLEKYLHLYISLTPD